MDEFKVKEVMEHVHISSQMQEDIIRNLHKRRWRLSRIS